MSESVGEWEFLSSEQYSLGKIHIIHSRCGTGKTRSIRNFLDANSNATCMAISYRQSLASKLASEFKATCYLDDKDLKDYHRVVVSIESLSLTATHRSADGTHGIPLPDVLVLDEFASLLDHLFNLVTLDCTRIRLFMHLLTACVDLGKTIFISDAYLCPDLLSTLVDAISDKLNGDTSRLLIIKNLYTGVRKKLYYTHSLKTWMNVVYVAFNRDEKKIFHFTNWKKISDLLYTLYGVGDEEDEVDDPHSDSQDQLSDFATDFPKKASKSTLYISRDSSKNTKLRSSQDTDTLWSKYRNVFITPTVGGGVSFDVKHHFDLAIGFVGRGSSGVLGSLQQSWRVRHLGDNKVIIYIPKTSCPLGSRYAKIFRKKFRSNGEKLNLGDTVTTGDVTRNLLKLSRSVDKKFAELISLVPQYSENILTVIVDEKEMLTRFAIYHLKYTINSSYNPLYYWRLLSQNDNFEFIQLVGRPDVEPPPADTDEAVASNEPLIHDLVDGEFGPYNDVVELIDEKSMEELLRLRTDADPVKLVKLVEANGLPQGYASIADIALKYGIESLSEWDGMFSFAFNDSGVSQELVQVREFIGSRNCLGFYGGLNHMVTDHIFESITCMLKFNTERCIMFSQRFAKHAEHQNRFENLLNGIFKVMVESKNRATIGLPPVEYVLDVFALNFFSLLGVCPIINMPVGDGVSHPVLFPGSEEWARDTAELLDERIHSFVDIQAMHRADFPYTMDIEMERLRSLNNVFVVYDEKILGSADKLLQLRALFSKFWYVITHLVCSREVSGWTEDFAHSPIARDRLTIKGAQFLLRMARNIIKSLIMRYGMLLEPIPASDRRTTVALEPSSDLTQTTRRVLQVRLRFRRYQIRGFRERLMIALCNTWKSVSSKCLWYPEVDPFRLLYYNPISHLSTLNRFKRAYRSRYEHLPSVCKSLGISAPSDAVSNFDLRQIYPDEELTDGDDLRSLVHVSLSNVTEFCLICRFFGEQDSSRAFKRAIYSPVLKRIANLNNLDPEYPKQYIMIHDDSVQYQEPPSSFPRDKEILPEIWERIGDRYDVLSFDLLSRNDKVKLLSDAGLDITNPNYASHLY